MTPDETEEQTRAELQALARMPHMHPALRELFLVWSRPSVTCGEVLEAVKRARAACDEVEAFASGRPTA